MIKRLLIVVLVMLLLVTLAATSFAAITRVDLLRKTDVAVAPKGTIQFSAKAYDGETLVTTAKFTWSCDPNAGKISTSGLFTASTVANTYENAVTVTVTGTAISQADDVQIKPGLPSKVFIDNGAPLAIFCAATHQYTAYASDSYGNEVDAPGPIVFSTVVGSKVGTINAEGELIAGSVPGNYASAIIAKSGTLSGKASVTVLAPPPTRVALFVNKTAADAAIDATAGSKLTFSAIGYDLLDRAITGLKFKFTADPECGVVNASTGAYVAATTADSTGDITAQALINAAPAGYIASTTVTIVPAVASKVVIDPSTVTLACAETQQFSAAVTDKYNNPIDDKVITWANAKVAAGTIDADLLFTAGNIPGKYAGAITATCGTLKGSAAINVVAPPPTRVAIFANKVEEEVAIDVAAGSKTIFTAVGYDALDRPITGLKFSFTAGGNCGTIVATSGAYSANTTAGNSGTVSARALINGIPAGEPGEVEITIVANKAAKVVIDPTTASVPTSDTQQFEALVQDMYGNTVEDAPLVWTALATAGTIDDDTGLFTAGLTPGKYATAVTATSGTIKAVATVTVTPQPPVQVKLMINGVDAASEEAQVVAGTINPLKAEAYDINGLKMSYMTFSYKPDQDVNIGSISSTGVYTVNKTAGNMGTIEIQPIYSGAPCGEIFYATVSIVPAAPKTVTIDPTSVVLSRGGTASFGVTKVTDAYDNEISESEITWSLPNTVAGTLTEGGNFMAGETAGKYTIKATATKGTASAFATANITVLSETALEHLQWLMDQPYTPSFVLNEYNWFNNYYKANPTDPVGILGASITKFSKSVFTLAQKYGMPGEQLVQATTFRSALALATSENIAIDQNTVLGLMTNRSVLGTSGSNKPNLVQMMVSNASADNGGISALATPTPTTIANDIKVYLIPAIQDAITTITPLVDREQLIATFIGNDENEYSVGAEEVLAFRAALRSMLGVLSTVTAYSWDPGTFNFDRSLAQFDKNQDGHLTPSEYVPGGTFATLTNRTSLNTGWTAINAALTDARTIVESVQADNLAPSQLLSMASSDVDWDKLKIDLDKAAEVLAGPVETESRDWLAPYYEETVTPLTVNVSAFWTTPIANLRSIMPTFSYVNEFAEIDSIPDMTLGGLLPNGATEVPGQLWDEWFNFFDNEGDSWWCEFDPWDGQDGVSIYPTICMYMYDAPDDFVVKLYKTDANQGWVAVDIDRSFSDAENSYYEFTPKTALTSDTWYRICAYSSLGIMTSYFKTSDAAFQPLQPADMELMINGTNAMYDSAEVVTGSTIALKPVAYDYNGYKQPYYTFSFTVEGNDIGTVDATTGLYIASTVAGSNGTIMIQPMYAGEPFGEPWPAYISIVRPDTATEHLEKLIGTDNGPADIPAEYDWFDNYVKSNPTDKAGTLGFSIIKLMKSVYTLAQKYGIPEEQLLQASTFRSALALATSEDVVVDQKTVIGLMTNRSVLGASGTAKPNLVQMMVSNASAVNSGISALATPITPATIANDIKVYLIPALQDAITSVTPLVTVVGPIVTLYDQDENEYSVGAEEALAFRAALKSMLGILSTVTAYSWDPGTFNFDRDLAQFDTSRNGLVTPAEYLPGGAFGTLTNRTSLDTGWAAINASLTDARAIVASVQAGNLAPSQLLSIASSDIDWDKLKKGLDRAAVVLAGPVETVSSEWVAPYFEEIDTTLTVNVKAFWTTPITDLRTIMPTFRYFTEYGKSYGEVSSVPNKTLGGLLPNGATEVPAQLWKEWFNFFEDDGDSWWCDLQPSNNDDDVYITDKIYVGYYDWGPTDFHVRLYKQGTDQAWTQVTVNLTDSGPDYNYPNAYFREYTPVVHLDTLTWYRIDAFSDRGRVTAYFKTNDIEIPPAPAGLN